MRRLTALERLQIESSDQPVALSLMLSLCDEDGDQVYFCESTKSGLSFEQADLDDVLSMDGMQFEILVAAMNAHCASPATWDEAVEEAAKN